MYFTINFSKPFKNVRARPCLEIWKNIQLLNSDFYIDGFSYWITELKWTTEKSYSKVMMFMTLIL